MSEAVTFTVFYKKEPYQVLVDRREIARVFQKAREEGYEWRLRNNGYVALSTKPLLYLHRFLMGGAPGDGFFVDHINRNRLDNRSANLRRLTPGQSCQNVGSNSRSITGYRGVQILTGNRKKPYQASLKVENKRYYLGTFATPEEAAKVAAAARAELAPYSQEAFDGWA